MALDYRESPEDVEAKDADWLSLVGNAIEQEMEWLEELVGDHLLEICSTVNHPLGRRIRMFAEQNAKHFEQVSRSKVLTPLDVEPVCDTIKSFTESIHNIVLMVFPLLDTSELPDAAIDLATKCYAPLEEAVFRQLAGADVPSMFRRGYRDFDIAWGNALTSLRNASPMDLGVNPKYIFDAESLAPARLEPTTSTVASFSPFVDAPVEIKPRSGVYAGAVERLRGIEGIWSPMRKLACIKAGHLRSHMP